MTETGQVLTTFLLNSLWQIPLIAAAAALCSRLMLSVPTVYRHLVWVAALGLCLCLPIKSLWSSNRVDHTFSPASSQVSEPDHGDRELGGNLAHKRFSFMRQTRSFHVPFTPYLTWIFGSCFAGFFLYRLARIGWSLRCTLKLRDSAYTRILPGPLFSIVMRCSRAFAVPEVAILYSPDTVGPVTLSFPRPVLILPNRFFTEVSEADFSSAVCHELAHINRHDFMLNLFYEVVSIPVSFHPALMWIKNRLALTRELACDEAAATKLASRTHYAQCLLNLAQSANLGTTRTQSNAALGLFDTNTLEERIMNLLRKPNRSDRVWGTALALAATSLLTVASVGISAFSFQVAKPGNPSDDSHRFVGTWTASHEGTPFLILELHSEKGSLAGGIKVCSFNLDMVNGINDVTISDTKFTESLPVNNLRISDKSVMFDWKDPDGDEVHWKLEATSANAGRLSWMGLPDGAKVAPLQVIREVARTP
jgi:beta-lactamase regulating signal transducer with metallopeptidase domain